MAFSEGYYPGSCEKCRTLEDKKACIVRDFYPPGLIKYCRNQIIWLIGEVLILDPGEWPMDGDDSESSRSQRSPFELASMIRGELELRLSTTGRSGETLVWQIQENEITDYDSLAPTSKDALNYVTGRFKVTKFLDWLRQRDYRNKLKE